MGCGNSKKQIVTIERNKSKDENVENRPTEEISVESAAQENGNTIPSDKTISPDENGCGNSKKQIVTIERNKSKDENVENQPTEEISVESAAQEDSNTVPSDKTISPDDNGCDTFEQEALAAHNEYRRVHDAPPLQLDLQMCQEAKEYAKKLAKAKQMEHSTSVERDGQGENLAFSGGTGGSQMTGKCASEMWYSEVKDYNFQKPGFSMTTGHFTQLVWKGSEKFGIGSADYEDDGMQCTMVVGRYFPSGNVLGNFKEYVSRGSYRK